MKKIIIINFVVFIFLFFLLNWFFENNVEKINRYTYEFVKKNVKSEPVKNKEYQTEEYPPDFKRLELTKKTINDFCGEERTKFGQQYNNKKPVIILGCSYPYGHGLKKEETFPYLLSELTKRSIYNFSYCAGNLYDAFNEMELGLDNNIIQNTEYFIYIYMIDHIDRYLFIPIFMKMEEETLKREGKFRFWHEFFIVKYLLSAFKLKNILEEYPSAEKSSLYLKNLIINMNNKIKQKNPNAKFIIIVYDEKIPIDSNVHFLSEILNSHIWKDIEAETDIRVIETKDLTGFYFDKNYKLKEDIAGWHPNAKAWELLTPLIAKEIK